MIIVVNIFLVEFFVKLDLVCFCWFVRVEVGGLGDFDVFE